VSTTAISVHGLVKSYKGVPVLRGVDLDVEAGTVLALLGANGAGKTTLIRVLATLQAADGGTCSVAGHDITEDPLSVRKASSLTGQFAAVDEILSGRENLQLIARLRHHSRPRQAAEDLLRRFALQEAADRRVGTYSGGMRRRLDIAMSLVGDPAVLYLDEPTTGLDPAGRAEVWQTMRALADAGTTVLLTTQYLEEAEQLADRIAILHEGRILVTGTLAELHALLPPREVEHVQKQPGLEDVFLALTAAGSGGMEESL